MRSFCILVTILTIISCSNLISAQEIEVPSEQVPPTPAVSEEKPKPSEEIVLIDDYLPENSTMEGTWDWDAALKYSGEKSHTQPAAKEIAQHSYKANPIEVPKRCVIEQYVYLDPNEIPKGIMLKFSVENGPSGGEVGVYWEGEEEVFIFNNDEPMLYYGVLPNAGKWEKLQVYAEDLGLEGVKLTGIIFITYGGKANWDLTKIRPVKEDEGYPLEEELTVEEFKK